MGLELQHGCVGDTSTQVLTIIDLHCLFLMFSNPGAQLSKQPTRSRLAWGKYMMTTSFHGHSVILLKTGWPSTFPGYSPIQSTAVHHRSRGSAGHRSLAAWRKEDSQLSADIRLKSPKLNHRTCLNFLLLLERKKEVVEERMELKANHEGKIWNSC